MKKAISRPRTLAADQLDLALEEALMRVSMARELNKEECAQISGGINLPGMDPAQGLGGPTVGYAPPPPDFGTYEM